MLMLIELCLSFSSCASFTYQQIATLQSEQVHMEAGKFVDKNDLVTVEYDFWDVAGKVSFAVFNNTSEDVYIDLSKSYYIKNGYAYDYYQNRRISYMSSSSNSVSSSATASTSSSSSSSRSRHSLYNYPLSISSDGSSVGVFLGNQNSASVSISEQNEYGVEYIEQSIVCIPANSYKRFYEFNVFSSLYRECGFGRFPSKDELSIKEFKIEDSPIVIENRLVFIKDSVEIPVSHTFYISQFQNIELNDATIETYPKDCRGNKSIEPVYYHKLGGPNRFYVVYKR